MINTSADITLNLVHASHGEDYFSLEITDRHSRERILEAHLSFTDYARLIGRGGIHDGVPTKFYDPQHVGMKVEHKHMPFTTEGGSPSNKHAWERIRAQAREHEVDGWVANHGDYIMENHHNWKRIPHTDESTIVIHFHRYVPHTNDEEEE